MHRCTPVSITKRTSKSRQHLLKENNQLDAPYLALLTCLSHRQAHEPELMLIEDAPMLIDEIAEVEEEVIGLVEEAGEDDNEGQEEPVLQEIKDEHQLPPYQLTIHYWQQ